MTNPVHEPARRDFKAFSGVKAALQKGPPGGLAVHRMVLTILVILPAVSIAMVAAWRLGLESIEFQVAAVTVVSAGVLSVLITRRALTMEHLEAEHRRAQQTLQARVRQQTVVAELGQEALAGGELGRLMDNAVARVAQALGVELVSILELQTGGRELLLRAGGGWKAGCVGRVTVPAGPEWLDGFTLAAAVPVVAEDLRTEKRFSAGPLLGEHGVVSGATVAIGGPNRRFGVLGGYSTQRHAFSRDDVLFLQTVANELASAIARHRTEELTRASAEQYRLLFETNPQPMWVYDPQTLGFLAVNEAAIRLYGYSREEFLARTLQAIWPAEDAPVSSDPAAASQTADWLASTKEHRKKNGARLPVETRSHPLVFGGRPARLMLLTDLTARQETELALREGQEMFSNFMNNSPAVAFMKDPAGRLLYVNATFERVFNTTLAAVRGKTDIELWPAEVARQLRANDQRVLAASETVELSEQIPTPDGVLRQWLTFKFPFRDAAGRLFLGGIAMDITEYREMIEALSESEKQFRDLFESSPDPILVEDLQGRVLDVNPAASRLHRQAREALVGRNVLELVPAEHRQEMARELARMIAGESDHTDGYSLTADGVAIPVSMRASRRCWCTSATSVRASWPRRRCGPARNASARSSRKASMASCCSTPTAC